jgi:hypothetical protein
MLETWLWMLLACDWTLSIALLTLLTSLLSLPHPVAAMPAIPSATADAPIAATRVNLLDWFDMVALLLPRSIDAGRPHDGLY